MKENELKNILIEKEQPLVKPSNLLIESPNEKIDINLQVNSKKLSSYYTSSPIGKFFFNWTRYAMKLANKNPLKIPYFNGVGEEDCSQNLLKPLSERWYIEKKKLNEENLN